MYGTSKHIQEVQKKYENVEKVLIDFGKQYTKLVQFEGEHHSNELDFEGYKMYFIAPPNLYLEPSNVIIFELIWLSSQTSQNDYVMAWGAFPLVNGDFEINQGKFKLPLMNGEIDFTSNKFKDIEQKYIRNIDEWLANIYIEVKTFELIGFQMNYEKVELLVPKEEAKKIQQKRQRRAEKARLSNGFAVSKQEMKAIKNQIKLAEKGGVENNNEANGEEDDEDAEDVKNKNKIYDDDSDFQSDLEDQAYVADGKIDYHQFKYTVQQSNSDLKTQHEFKDLSMRKL